MFPGLVGAVAVAEVEVDCNDGEVVVVADENPVEEGVVVVVGTVAVEVEVALAVDGALCEDDDDNDDAPPSFIGRLSSQFQ